MTHRLALALLLLSITLNGRAWADDAFPPIERKLPPAGVRPESKDVETLQSRLENVQARVESLRKKSVPADALADVEVFEKAVRYALAFDEFYPAGKSTKAKAGESTKAGGKGVDKGKAEPGKKAKPLAGVATALSLLDVAATRLDALERGQTPWAGQKGLVVRGYTSAIDGSCQPYGLDIGPDVDPAKPGPLYVWLHGRGDTNTDLYFIDGRMKKPGDMTPDGVKLPKNCIVLHPFGRQCVGYKSAGEIDVLDAIESVKRRYKIDADHVALAGFSMGGAGVWHVGAHYADRFCLVQPGAGFIDVQRYQKLDPAKTPPAERTLWGAYDVPDYVMNLFNVPVLSYSGENDKQRASAEIMAGVYQEHGKTLPQFIGPNVEHKYLPLPELLGAINKAISVGRDPYPKQVALQTRTLRYSQQFWVEVTGLNEHWKDTHVQAAWEGETLTVDTANVTGLRLHLPADKVWRGDLILNRASQKMSATGTIDLAVGENGTTSIGGSPQGLAKVPGLQGPIDDAFMSPFMFVAPSGKSDSPAVQKWVDFEMKHQQDRWRALMRGDARVKRDVDVTPDDIRDYNLVLWGDSSSNALIAKVAGQLPIALKDSAWLVGAKAFDAKGHVAAQIAPNPLNPQKYVVLNSGLTFREGHDGTNSQQNPKLGDWAIIDVTQPPTDTAPGGVVANGFFDERWALKP